MGSLPVLNFPGRIKLIMPTSPDDEIEIRSLLDLTQSDRPSILGFDTESRPSPSSSRDRNRTALIQLSSANACVLWRTTGGSPLPGSVRRILSDPSITKVGQGVTSDMQYLRSDFPSLATTPLPGFIDLFPIGTRLNCQPKSLQGLVALFLRKRLLKDMRISNWEDPILRAEQVQYAALDAWASRAVFLEMRSRFDPQVWAELESVGRVNGDAVVVKPAPIAFPPDRVISTPSPSRTSPSPQIRLVELCVLNGFKLRMGEFEKALGGGVRSSFEVVLHNGEILIEKSKNPHSSLREAQADAAEQMLNRLSRK
jgi:ribonuclease D